MDKNIFKKLKKETTLDDVYQTYKEDLHILGLGEVAGEKEREFDWENYGLNSESVEKKVQRSFNFDYDLEKVRKFIKKLEQVLQQGGEEAWAMPERSEGKFLEQCFAGLEYLEDPKEVFASLVFRLTKNHPLEDGNKRISSLLFVQGLLDNGLSLKEVKEIVDLEEFGMVLSQLESQKIEEVRKKINKFLVDLGFK